MSQPVTSQSGNGVDAMNSVAMGFKDGVQLMPSFDDPHEERAYLKGRLALAFRIFGQRGYDEG